MAFWPAATIAAICLVAPAHYFCTVEAFDYWMPTSAGFSSFRPMAQEFPRLSIRQKNGRHRCRPASGGEEKEILL